MDTNVDIVFINTCKKEIKKLLESTRFVHIDNLVEVLYNKNFSTVNINSEIFVQELKYGLKVTVIKNLNNIVTNELEYRDNNFYYK
jgi:hypothetical protein